jgi:hypothetical protein
MDQTILQAAKALRVAHQGIAEQFNVMSLEVPARKARRRGEGVAAGSEVGMSRFSFARCRPCSQ